MKKLLTKIALVMAGTTGIALAQQDPQFTQFMYNKMFYNAGYAGTSGGVCGNLQFRQQWASFDGAPQSIALSGDMALKGMPLGVGVNVVTDKIGPMSTLFFRLAGSYHLKKIGRGVMGLGLDVGILQKSISSDWIVPEPLKDDPSIPGVGPNFDNPDLNKVTFDVGAGVFYQIPGEFYAGLSTAHLPAQSITEGEDLSYKLSRHYYLMTGYTFKLNPWSKLTPQILMRSDIAATTLDANLTYLWSDMIWVGGSYRTTNVGAILAGFQGKAGYANTIGYKIGISYDLNTAATKTYFGATYEILLGVCYTPTVKKETSYGNERYLD